MQSLDDLRELAAITSTRLRSVVVGEPLFDGRIDLLEANRAVDA